MWRHRETWRVYENIGDSSLAQGPRSGDLRAAIAPFIANKTAGMDTYKWLLYGDDDTVFNIPAVLRLVNGLDHKHPYLLSDCLWFPQGTIGATKLHPNREAPRCLPCEATDPLLADPRACAAADARGGVGQFPAPRTCECTPAALCRADTQGIFDKASCETGAPRFKAVEGDARYPHAGWWYMIHGGAGALISAGLMARSSYPKIEAYYLQQQPQSGDAMFMRALWNVMRIAPTDPGYGYCRPGIQMFDPGWRGQRARGSEDAGTLDGGADPAGVLARLELLLDGQGDAESEEQMYYTVALHVRGKYAAADWLGGGIGSQHPDDLPPTFRAARYLIRKLGVLFDRLEQQRLAKLPPQVG